MNILLTNDDGIYAEGIRTLARHLSKIPDYKITAIAPDRERSASGHSITLNRPLRIKKLSENTDAKFYNLDGTPADCVKIGIERLCKPDLVISGINHGPNIGYDVFYSGTVAAAVEGWMMGYSSFAISLNLKEKNNFQTAANITEQLIKKIQRLIQKEKVLLNINVPDLKFKKIKGIAATKLGKNIYEDYYEERTDPSGKKYYWLAGDFNKKTTNKTDINALNNSKISVTPLKLDLTNNKQLKILNDLL